MTHTHACFALSTIITATAPFSPSRLYARRNETINSTTFWQCLSLLRATKCSNRTAQGSLSRIIGNGNIITLTLTGAAVPGRIPSRIYNRVLIEHSQLITPAMGACIDPSPMCSCSKQASDWCNEPMKQAVGIKLGSDWVGCWNAKIS